MILDYYLHTARTIFVDVITDLERSLELAATHESVSVEVSADVERKHIKVDWVSYIARLQADKGGLGCRCGLVWLTYVNNGTNIRKESAWLTIMASFCVQPFGYRFA
jgi:hypothetical protein